MSFFFLTVFAIYGGVHVYVFLRARNVFAFGPEMGAALAVFMLVMTFAPVLIHLFERYGYELAARTLSYIAYLWMALIFIFFCSSLLVELVNLVSRILDWATRAHFPEILIQPRVSFFLCLGVSFVICAYGYFDAKDIRTERLRIETSKLPVGMDRLTIVQISDVHLGLIVRNARLENILAAVKEVNPDMLISTGDLVDGQINQLSGLAELLRQVSPRYGKFAVTGNHEFYAGLEKALIFTREAGFTILRGEAVSSGPINIAGVDDHTGVQMGLLKPVSERALLEALPKDKFTLFLKHQPRVAPEALGLFDLQISGHTHKGQIYPFTYLSALTYPMNAGRYNLTKGSILYVSRGSGTWGPPIRFLSPPEITVIELARKSQ
jgi:predicted MPP superfamily phosphohydrolase